MKKQNIYFFVECLVIVALLGIIGLLIKEDAGGIEKNNVPQEVIQEVEKEEEEVTKTITTVSSIQVEESKEAKETKETKETTGKVTSVQEKIELDNQIKVVVFGDSIWNAERGENGISEQVMEATGVKIYNCAIGGTTAAVVNESTDWDSWTSRSFNGMMYIANDVVSKELISKDEAYEVMKEVDFEEVDYVIISYGLNDYFSDVPVHPQEYYDLTSYVGALRHGIQKLKEEYPQIKFIITSPTYCGWFEGERQFRLDDYVEAARGVAAEYDAYFLDMFHALGKNPEEKSKYLEDGVHLTDEGLTMYAKSVIEFFNKLPKEAE